MLVAKLMQNQSLLVVQRERLEEVIREQAFQLSGRVADESSVRVGQLAGATVLVTGSIAVVNGLLRLDAQLLGVEQGLVIGTAAAEGPATEVPSVTRDLLSQIMRLFPGSGSDPVMAEEGAGLWSSAKANYAGETLSRAGKMVQALEEFEQAIAANPHNPAPRSNYAKIIQGLSEHDFIRVNEAVATQHNERTVANRIVERLAGSGIDVEIGSSRAVPQADGSMTVHVPVRLRLDPKTVETVLQSVRAVGGRVEEKPGEERPIEMALPSNAALNQELRRAIGETRRLYLRLLSSNGQTIAVYSDFLNWRLSVWLTPMDGERVRLASLKVVVSEAKIAGMSLDHIAAVSNLKVTVDSVPNEHALVRVDLSEPEDDVHDDPKSGAFREQRRLDRYTVSEELSSLRTAIARVWNPPIMERPWGRGYLPSNERTAAVIIRLSEDTPVPRQEIRLARASGDTGFDRACVDATRAAVRDWLEDGGGQLWNEGPRRMMTDRQSLTPSRVLKARIHFRLRKDVPALNLIGVRDRVEPLQPALASELPP